MNDNINKVLDKIQKLLSLANNNQNINEASAAAAQAQLLMSKYNLTMCMVELHGGKQAKEGVIDFVKKGDALDKMGKKVLLWKSLLANIVSRVNNCRAYVNKTTNGENVIGLVGRKDEAEMTKYLYKYLIQQIEDITHKHSKGKGNIWANNFRLGAVQEIQNSLNKALKEAKESMQLYENNVNVSGTLALYDQKGEEAEQYMKENLQLARPKNSEYDFDYSAFVSGRIAARKINVNIGKGLYENNTNKLSEG